MVAHIFTLLWHLLRPNWSIIRGTVRLYYFGRIRNRHHFPSKTAILQFSNIFQRLTLPRKIYQFGRKKCKKKGKDVREIIQELLQNNLVVHERSAVKKAYHKGIEKQ